MVRRVMQVMLWIAPGRPGRQWDEGGEEGLSHVVGGLRLKDREKGAQGAWTVPV